MDIATLAGIIVFIGLAIGAIFHAEGVAGFKPFINMEALLMVMGGTFCATLVNFPLKQVVGMGKIVKKTLTTGREDITGTVGTFVQLASKAKRDGFLALQADVAGLDDDFVKRGVQLV